MEAGRERLEQPAGRDQCDPSAASDTRGRDSGSKDIRELQEPDSRAPEPDLRPYEPGRH